MIVGLTGSSGAGKSTVSKVFSTRGFSVINADEVARTVLSEDKACAYALCAAFGNDIVTSDMTIDRRTLAQRAFSSKKNTQMLNDITHPAIFLRTLKMCRGLIDSGNKKIVFDAPVLFESHSEIMCDCVVCVTAPKQIRIERLMKRDNLPESEIIRRLSAQHDDDYYISRADFSIDGGQAIDDVLSETNNIIDKLT
ncbi:MAG: dephospho-CoA kinase [Clostridia bacterium]|nr:dephospho-CoA kinase [Clostridia bacterium]